MTETLSWKNVSVGDECFFVKDQERVPCVHVCTIRTIKLDDDVLEIPLRSKKLANPNIIIDSKHLNASSFDDEWFLSKQDANKKLKAVLTERLVEISTALGGIK